MCAKKLQGQVAIVTGGSRGIGAATAQTLARAGAAVVIVGRDGDRAQAVADAILAEKGNAIAIPADVSDPDEIEPVFEVTLDTFRRIDILVNNAAVVWPLEEVADADLDEWAYALQVNLIGLFAMTRTALPVMQAQGRGRIVNVSSGAARSPIRGASAYCASKAGVDMFTRVLASELAGTQITANILYPGMVATDMQVDIRSVDTSESPLDFQPWHDAHARGALRTPESVADAILWLVGPWGESINGELLDVTDDAFMQRVSRELSR